MPLSISYEWEPCDSLKTQELYTRTVGEYTKTPEADMNSMVTGLKEYKGRVHFHLDRLTDDELDELDKLPSNGERIEALGSIIDRKSTRTSNCGPTTTWHTTSCIRSINSATCTLPKRKTISSA